MTGRLGRVAGWGLGAACAWGLAPSSQAQSFGPPVVSQAQRPAALATMGAGYSNPYANPYTNPMMNPFLNPYMTQLPTNQSSTLLYFMAAQQQRGGIGSSTGLGGSQEGALPGAAGAAPGMAGGLGAGAGAINGSRSAASTQPSAASRVPAGRVSPVRPTPNYHVAGRFDDNPSYNDRRSRLAKQYPAYGKRAANAETGAPVTAGSTPAPNVGAARTFNRYPSYNTNNDR
jgi:hypothetical protein